MRGIGLLLLFGMVSLAQATAHATETIETVKVTSGKCNGPVSSAFQGSGVMVSHKGRAYVLTSDHVVLHSNDGFCHSVWNEKLGKQSAKFLFSDWGWAMALLEVPAVPIDTGWPVLGEGVTVPFHATPVSLRGFPFGSQSLLEAGGFMWTMFEVWFYAESTFTPAAIHAHAEFGMSGGPAIRVDSFTNQPESLVGILTHIVPEGVDAGPERVSLLGRPDLENRIAQFFETRNHLESTFWQSSDAQLSSNLILHVDNLTLEFVCTLICEVRITPNDTSSWGTPAGIDREWTQDKRKRVLAGENFASPFRNARAAKFLERFKAIGPDRKGLVRKFQQNGAFGFFKSPSEFLQDYVFFPSWENPRADLLPVIEPLP